MAQYLPKRYRAGRLSSADRNRAALYGYRCLERMERWGGRVSERAVELARKAKFSQHTLTPEVERLVFRFLWGMPRRPRPGEGDPPPENRS